MKRRIILSAWVDITLDASYYGDGLTEEEMLAADIGRVERNPQRFLTTPGVQVCVTGELVDEGRAEE